MKTIKLLVVSALIGVSTAALADYDGSRDDRMKSALDDYHGSKAYQDSRNPHPGRAARAEASMKRGAHNTGQAIKRGAQKTGHAIGTGLHKTGEAIDHEGDKLKSKSTTE